MNLSPLPIQKFFDSNGVPLVNGLLFTYAAGTTTKIGTAKDQAGTANANPIQLDYRGEANVWLDQTLTYKFTLAPAGDTDPPTKPIWTVDNISAAVTYVSLTQQILGQILYPRNAAEIAVSASIIQSWLPYGNVPRYGINTTPGTTDMVLALQAAIDSASFENSIVTYNSLNGISKPLLLRTTTLQGIQINGTNKSQAVIEPLSVSISTAPQNVNCCIFVQNNNAHLKMTDFGTFATAGFTGVFIYCKEGGGGDASGQCLFSAVFRDAFIDFPTTNSGFLLGATQNTFFESMTFESAISVFRIEGGANADNHYTDLSLFNCYDQLMMQTADTVGSVMLQFTNINAYSHNRGVLFDVKNWDGCTINQLILEPKTGAVSADAIGVGKFTDCINCEMTGVISRVRTGVPAGETILEFAGANPSSWKVADSILTGTRAVKVSSTGVVSLEFDNCDFSTAASSCFDIAAAVASGSVIRTRNCKFNNAQIRCLVHSVGNAASWYSYNDEFLNAGLGGNVASRNLDLSSSGEIILYNPRIGQNVGASAAAAYYIACSGGGTVTIYDPVFVGTPPSGLVDPASTVTPAVNYRRGYGGSLASAATITLPHFGDAFDVSGTTNITSITANSTAPQKGRSIRLKFSGALTFTDGSNLQLAGNFVTTADDTISLTCFDGTNWTETGRSVN